MIGKIRDGGVVPKIKKLEHFLEMLVPVDQAQVYLSRRCQQYYLKTWLANTLPTRFMTASLVFYPVIVALPWDTSRKGTIADRFTLSQLLCLCDDFSGTRSSHALSPAHKYVPIRGRTSFHRTNSRIFVA